MAGIFDLPDFYFFYFTKGTVNPAFLSIFFYIPEFPHSHIVLLFCFQFRHRKRILFLSTLLCSDILFKLFIR